MKVWIVYEMLTDCPGDHPEVNKTVCGVFDSEEKAVCFIRDKVDDDHVYMKYCKFNFDRERYVQHELYGREIVEGEEIISYEYYEELVSYLYESHDVQ